MHTNNQTTPAPAAELMPSLRKFNDLLETELGGAQIELPSFPDVALRVRRALADPAVSIEQVVRVVSAEPSLVVQLLQLANSAALNPGGRRFIDLRSAIARIGFSMARNATIAFAMSQLRRAEAYKGLEQPFNELWHTSTNVAAISYVTARRFTRITPDLALLAGLVHTVGKLYLLTRSAKFPELRQDAGVYRGIVRDWHSRIAAVLLEKWEMAPALVAAVRNFESGDQPCSGDNVLLDVLWVANALATLTPGEEPGSSAFFASAPAKRLQIGPAEVALMLDESAREISSLRSALGD